MREGRPLPALPAAEPGRTAEDKNVVEMENYGSEPVRLNQIKIVKD